VYSRATCADVDRWRRLVREWSTLDGRDGSAWDEYGRRSSPGLLDANYRRVPGRDELGRQPALSTVVHASGCAPLLLYVLLYGLDTYPSRQLGESLVSRASSTGVGPRAEANASAGSHGTMG
jgi:hypothetical protein